MQNADIVLNNGLQMPRIGLGTYRTSSVDVRDTVTWAVQAGLRLIDTASIYKNESAIQETLEAMHESIQQLPFLTSKISPYEHGALASKACKDIIERLGRVDLLLIHWPGVSKVSPDSEENAVLRHETWRVMEDFYLAGRCKAIGVSNFTVKHLEALLKVARVCPAVNQVELHPFFQQRELQKYCVQEGIAITAYASLGSGSHDLLGSSEIKEVALDVQKSPAQVLLRWALQHGCAVIPKSTIKHRIEEWTEDQLLNWELSLDQMAVLDALPDGIKYCWDPENIL